VAAARGLTLADKQAVHRALLASGASIGDELRAASPVGHQGRTPGCGLPSAPLVTLLIFDVPGDDPIAIASGPTVGDPTTCAEALVIVERCGIAVPPAVRDLLRSGTGETVKPDDERLSGIETHMITTPQVALEAAASAARAAGFTQCILGDSLEGEAREIGKAMAGIARQVACTASRCCLPAYCCPAARRR
jgi:glycerate 2-kinase